MDENYLENLAIGIRELRKEMWHIMAKNCVFMDIQHYPDYTRFCTKYVDEGPDCTYDNCPLLKDKKDG